MNISKSTIILFIFWIKNILGAEYNEAFAASVLYNVAELIAEPWDRVLNIAAGAFDSGPNYIFKNNDVSKIDLNNTQEFVWNLFRPVGSSIDWIYSGFTDGAFIAYSQPYTLVNQINRNYSLIYYSNSTSHVTGKIIGPPSSSQSFDCTQRPWYMKSVADGDIWTDPYAFIDDDALGITAALQIVNSDGTFLGVFGSDYKLANMEDILVSKVGTASSNFYVIYIVDNQGLMIAASIAGVSSDGSDRVRANESSFDLIKLSAIYIEQEYEKNWTDANEVLLTIDVPNDGVYFVQSNELRDEHGLHWHVVVAELVSCDRGFYVKKAFDDVIVDSDEVCSPCIGGAKCEGDDVYPYPDEGYWLDRDTNNIEKSNYKCLWGTCLGFKKKMKYLYQRNELKIKHDNNDDDDFESKYLDDFDAYLDDMVTLCWRRGSLNSSVDIRCHADNLMCSKGSRGPLCGSCEHGYVFNAGVRGCLHCTGARTQIPAFVLGCFFILFIMTVTVRVIIIRGGGGGGSDDEKESHFNGKNHPAYSAHYAKRHSFLYLFATLLGKCKMYVLSLTPFAILKNLDRGMLKVLFTTLQIVSTASWNLNVSFPSPFSSFLEFISFLQLDFFEVSCFSANANFLHRVFLVSLAPLILAVLNYGIYLLRLHRPCYSHHNSRNVKFQRKSMAMSTSVGIERRKKRTSLFSDIISATLGRTDEESSISESGGLSHLNRVGQGNSGHGGQAAAAQSLEMLKAQMRDENRARRVANEHINFVLLLSYLVLPHVSLIQFSALECIHLNGGQSYLSADTSIDCNSQLYKNFVFIDIVLIIAFQSIPLLWFCLLYRVRRKLDPSSYPAHLERKKLKAAQKKAKNGSRGSEGDDDDNDARDEGEEGSCGSNKTKTSLSTSVTSSSSASSIQTRKEREDKPRVGFKEDEQSHEVDDSEETDHFDETGDSLRMYGASNKAASKASSWNSSFQSMFLPTSLSFKSSSSTSTSSIGSTSSFSSHSRHRKSTRVPFFWSFREIDGDILAEDDDLDAFGGKVHPLTKTLKLSNGQHSITQRMLDPTIYHLVFLWQDYHPSKWYHEVFDMYRRILFIAVLPLFSRQSAVRSAIGTALSVIMVAYVRETMPFIRNATNVLLTIGQYQIFAVYFAAFVISSEVLNSLGIDDLGLGLILLGLNVFIVVLSGLLCVQRYQVEKEQRSWRKKFSDNELDLINEIMLDQDEFNRIVTHSITGDDPTFQLQGEVAPDYEKQLDGENGKPSPNNNSPRLGGIAGGGDDGDRPSVRSISKGFGDNDLDTGGSSKPNRNLSKIASWFVEPVRKLSTSANAIELSNRRSARHSSRAASVAGATDSHHTPSTSSSSKTMSQNNKQLLTNFLLKSKDIRFIKKVGAGSFGEVFKGTCLSQPVAIKTMIQVTEENVKNFRAEILLTARLRHPNIVNFIGACWGRELTCLVLEWVPKGSLASLLEHPRRSSLLRWDDPLLKLATDIARGMNYLHGCEFYDESDRQFKKCILHRDLKPDNVLVTDFISSKITDFGTSRAKGVQFVTMTAVGTPLFCAPELARGENYDEKVDVYSFGLVLLNMAVNGSLIEYIGERWRIHNKKAKAPKQPMRFIRQMTEEGWRPISLSDLPTSPRSIVSLIVHCCAHDPKVRPSFNEVLRMLENQGAEEIHNKSGLFSRENIFSQEQPSQQYQNHHNHEQKGDHHNPIHFHHYNSFEKNGRSNSNPRPHRKPQQKQNDSSHRTITVSEQLMRNSSGGSRSQMLTGADSHGSLISQSSSRSSMSDKTTDSAAFLNRTESNNEDYGDAETVNTSQYWNATGASTLTSTTSLSTSTVLSTGPITPQGGECEFNDIPSFRQTESRGSWNVENPHFNT